MKGGEHKIEPACALSRSQVSCRLNSSLGLHSRRSGELRPATWYAPVPSRLLHVLRIRTKPSWQRADLARSLPSPIPSSSDRPPDNQRQPLPPISTEYPAGSGLHGGWRLGRDLPHRACLFPLPDTIPRARSPPGRWRPSADCPADPPLGPPARGQLFLKEFAAKNKRPAPAAAKAEAKDKAEVARRALPRLEIGRLLRPCRASRE
jgi:hypothetical protein